MSFFCFCLRRDPLLGFAISGVSAGQSTRGCPAMELET